MQRFLGFTGYFRKFIENYALIAKPLSDLIRSDVHFTFGSEQRQAFETLKNKICAQPVLMLFTKDAETELHTDASKLGIGAVLMQRCSDDNQFHPVYYLSYKTTPDQEKWISYELELFAIFTAVNKLRHYLLDIHFKVVTDCEALKTAMKKKDVRKVANWIMELQQFNFDIVHRSATKMQHVDALSRMYVIQTPSLLHSLKSAQNQDEHILAIKEVLKEKSYKDYVIHNELLCKFSNSEYRIVVPENMQTSLIIKYHQEGHFKSQKLEALINKEFYISNLRNKIEKVTSSCIECILAEKKAGKKEGKLHPISKEPIPLDTFHIDHLGPMPSTNKNYNHIFAIIDAFTKFVWLFAVKSTTANETINKLQIVTNVFGNPRRIIADKGTAFTSTAFQSFCAEENIDLIFTTTGVPRGNGQIERINRIIIAALSKISFDNPEKWYAHVDKVQKCINSTHQRSINTTPFELMFGVPMRNMPSEIQRIVNEEIVTEFNRERDELRTQAKQQIDKIQNENRKTYNAKRKAATNYQINDLVAITKTQFSTGAKLKPKLLGPYKITKSTGNDRYEVEKVGNHDGPFKTTTSADNMKAWPNINMMKLIRTPNDDIENHHFLALQKILTTTQTFNIAIEGNIGAGKTTLLNYFKHLDNTEILTFREPLEQWTDVHGANLLDLMYKDTASWIFPFQSFAMLSMFQIHTQKITERIKITERSVFSSRYCFTEMHLRMTTMNSTQYEILKQWFDFVFSHIEIKVDLIIYLRTTPNISLERIRQRNRLEEQDINIEYLELLHECHDDWLIHNKFPSPAEVITLDGNQTPTEIMDELDSKLNAIANRLTPSFASEAESKKKAGECSTP